MPFVAGLTRAAKRESCSARIVSSSDELRDSIVTRGAATRKKTCESEPSSSRTSIVTSIRGRCFERERRVVECLRANAEHDVADADRGAALGGERDSKLTEGDRVTVDGRLHEVHRRGADESRDEEIVRRVIEALRHVDLDDPAVAHDGDAVAERHRLRLVVRDVDARHCEARV